MIPEVVHFSEQDTWLQMQAKIGEELAALDVQQQVLPCIRCSPQIFKCFRTFYFMRLYIFYKLCAYRLASPFAEVQKSIHYINSDHGCLLEKDRHFVLHHLCTSHFTVQLIKLVNFRNHLQWN